MIDAQVEAAARALYDWDFDEAEWPDAAEVVRIEYRAMARSALEAAWVVTE